MKRILTLSILSFIVFSLQAQDDKPSPFENQEPRGKSTIYLAGMPPCLVGVALDYHKAIGLSEKTLEISEQIVNDAIKKAPVFKEKLRALEIELMNASLEERYADYEKILDKIAALKKEASLFHEGLVKRARKEYPKEDVKKIDDFIKKNQEVFLNAVGL